MNTIEEAINESYNKRLQTAYNAIIEEVWGELRLNGCSKCSEPCEQLKHNALMISHQCLVYKSVLN